MPINLKSFSFSIASLSLVCTCSCVTMADDDGLGERTKACAEEAMKRQRIDDVKKNFILNYLIYEAGKLSRDAVKAREI